MDSNETDKVIKIKSGQSGNSDKNNYIRTKRFEMRLSPDEYLLLDNRFKESGMNSMATYAREILLFDSIHSKIQQNKTNQEINLFMQAAGRIGNNINQIARVLNSQIDTPIKSQALNELVIIKEQLVSLQKSMSKMRGAKNRNK